MKKCLINGKIFTAKHKFVQIFTFLNKNCTKIVEFLKIICYYVTTKQQFEEILYEIFYVLNFK